MKLIIETGSKQHTSSYASAQAKIVDGPNEGQMLYQLKQNIRKTEWHEDTSSKWSTTEYDLPEGTIINYTGRGADGPRAVNRYKLDRLYMLTPDADVLEEEIHLGPRTVTIIGRLKLIRDLTEEQEKPIDRKEGF